MPLSRPEYQRRLGALRRQTRARVEAYWGTLRDFRDADMARFERLIVPTVTAAQVTAARLTANHLGGTVDRVAVTSARGVAPEEVYHRPAVTIYTALAGGAALDAAIRQGFNRAVDLATTDVQLAVTTQSQTSLQQAGHRRYRRVLSGSESCPLCEIAAQNLYSSADLLSIHGGCDCTVEPADEVTYVSDVSGLSTGRADQVAAGVPLADLVTVNQHGELGSVLGWASDHFTGPNDLAA